MIDPYVHILANPSIFCQVVIFYIIGISSVLLWHCLLTLLILGIYVIPCELSCDLSKLTIVYIHVHFYDK